MIIKIVVFIVLFFSNTGILLAHNNSDVILKGHLHCAVLEDNDIYYITLILLGCLLVIIFALFLYWLKRRVKTNVALSNLFLRRYAKTLNDGGNLYIKIFLTNVKTNKVSILIEDKYVELEGGINRVLECIHPDDRDTYIKQRSEFISGRIPTVTMNLRMLDERSKKYNLNDIVFNVLERDLLGKVLAYHVIRQNETLQSEALQKKYRDLHDLSMAVQSARLIRWDIDLSTNLNRFVNIDDNEYTYTNSQIFRRINPDDYSQIRSLIAQITQDKCVDSITIDIDIFDGGVRKSYEVMATLVCNEDGSPSHIYGILKDISKLLSYQKMLSREIYINKTIWQNVNNGVYFYDTNGLCNNVNNRGLNHFGFNENQLVGNLNLFELNHISEEHKDILRSGESISYQMSYQDVVNVVYNDCVIVDDVNDELFAVNCSPVFGDEKELIGYVSVYSDITDITRTRKIVEELNAKIALALDAGGLIVWTYDFKNDTYILLGNNTYSHIPKTMDDFFGVLGEKEQKVVKDAYEAIRTRKSKKETFIIHTPKGGISSIFRTTLTSREQEGEVLHLVGVSKDITKEVEIKSALTDANTMLDRQNSELNLNNQLLEEIIEQLPGLLFIKDIDDDFKFCIANTAFCDKILGKPMSEVIGYSDYDVFPKESADKFRSDELLCIESGEPIEVDDDFTRDGTNTWKTIKTPVTLANDRRMLICLSVDVTEIYRLKNEAQHSNALKSQFLANVSHELRTPLNAIVGFSNLLVDTDDSEIKREFNEIITVNSDLLLNLINDILDLSKIESGVTSFEDEYFNVNELLDDTYLTFSMRLQPGVTLKCVKLDEDWSVELDKSRFQQVINNFLSNAVKYTPSGEIIFGCIMERGGVRVFAKDTGIGIAEDNKVKVFERFEKLDTFAQGTGLGLSICKALVDLKGGDIGFESTLGEGSYFWVWLPCERKIE